MQSNSSTALEAFVYLTENIPLLLSRISELRSHTNYKHQEFVDAFKAHGVVRTRTRKNSSICSIRTDNSAKTGPGSLSTMEAAELKQDDAADSLPMISARYNIIIHYDEHTQSALQESIRNISAARNQLRRGRLSQLPVFGLRSSNAGDKLKSEGPPGAPSNISGSNDAHGLGGKAQPKEMPFESLDGMLEIAHSLCEKAAHKVLRAGECNAELDGVEENFTSVLAIAKAEVELFGERQTREEPTETETAAKISTTTKLPKRPAEDEDEESREPGTIEVDDGSSSVSAVPIDIKAFRVNRVARY